MSEHIDATPATKHASDLGLDFVVTQHGPVASLAEAAAARGVTPADIIKTLVVRRADDDFLFVLVPGDREISWPKLRGLLGVNRLSMPDAATAKAVPKMAPRTPLAIAGKDRPRERPALRPIVIPTRLPSTPAPSVALRR